MKIDNIEFTTDLMDIITKLQFELKTRQIDLLHKIIDGPKNVQVCCPYHKMGQERRPSAGISKSTGIFHCFGCDEVHTLPEVVSYCFGKNDGGSFGWQWLLRNFVYLETEDGKRDFKIDCSRDNNNVHSLGDKNYVTEEELDSYRYECDYWRKRGIVDEEIIEFFDLGYDWVSKCVTFPVRDIMGRCLFVAKRNVKTKFFQYPPGVKKPLYGLYELNATVNVNGHPVHILPNFPQEIFVCESMIDCILLWQSGHYAVAMNGLGNELQMKQLQDLPCRKLILCTDNDEAGEKARQRIRKQVKGKLFSEIIFPEDVKDIGECTREEVDNIKDWEVL